MGGDQRADQQARNQWEAKDETDETACGHAEQEVEDADGQRSAAHTVEFFKVDLQSNDEQQINGSDVGHQLQRFTIGLQQVQHIGSHQDPGQEQAN